MASESLIDLALAAVEAQSPIGLGQPLELPFDQLLVHAIYEAVRARGRGHGSDREVDRSIALARRGHISENEIDAAIAAGAEQESD